MRAEELILRVWTQKRQLLAAGKVPIRIVITRDDYAAIQEYHKKLGFLPPGVEDYISRYSLFDLPFFLDEGGDCSVVSEEEDSSTVDR
jgi:hypothetical protein